MTTILNSVRPVTASMANKHQSSIQGSLTAAVGRLEELEYDAAFTTEEVRRLRAARDALLQQDVVNNVGRKASR